MLSEELTKKAICITVEGSGEITNIINLAIQKYLEATDNLFKGKMTLKELEKQNLSLRDIPVSEKDIKGIEKVFKNYKVDFAVQEDTEKANTYKVFFKAKDVESIELALREYSKSQYKEENKTNEKMKEAKEKSIEIEETKEKNEKTNTVEKETI